MSKNYIYKDYVRHASHTMGGFPSHPIHQQLFLRACIARSAEHMVSVDELAQCFLKYKDSSEFISAVSESGKTPLAVAQHMAGVLCKFVFHGIEDVMLAKYQAIMQDMKSGDEFWSVVALAYHEKETSDAAPSAEEAATVSAEVERTAADFYVSFISEQFGGDDLRARNEVRAMTQLLLAKKPVEPLMNMPFDGKYDMFNPKHSIFPLEAGDVDRYNSMFKTEAYPSEFLKPAGIKWREYVTFAAGGNATDAVNTLVRVLRGEATADDYRTFEGIVNVAPAQKFYAELVGISHQLEHKSFSGLLDPARNLVYTLKTGNVDVQSEDTGFHPLAPFKLLTRNPFQHYDHAPPSLAVNNDENAMPQDNTEVTNLQPMSGLLDPLKNIATTIRTGNVRGEGETGFHPMAPLSYVKENPFHHYSKDVKKDKPSYYTVPVEAGRENVEVYDLAKNDKTDLLPMGGILDLADPRNLYNALRRGDPAGGSGKFNPLGPLNPSNVHKVLKKKNHQFENDPQKVQEFEDEWQKTMSEGKYAAYPSAPTHAPTSPPSPPSIESMHYDTSSTSSGLYSSPDSAEFGTTSTESLPVTMRSTISAMIAGHNITFPLLQQKSFGTHLREHMGITNEHLWSSNDLSCLHKAMNIMLLRMTRDDRCAVFDCFITAFANAKKNVLAEKQYSVELPTKIHDPHIFERVEGRDPSKSYLTKVPLNLDAVSFMTYLASCRINGEQTHVAILRKLMMALQDMMKKHPSIKAHTYVHYLSHIRRPSTSEPRDVTFQGVKPALVSIGRVTPAAVIGFLYHCIALLCNYSYYAYKEFNSIKMSSVFIGLPLSTLRA